MPIATRSGPAVILASDTITAFMAHSIVIDMDSPFPLRIEFVFESDPSEPDVAVRTEAGDGNFTLFCVNFDQPTGRGSAVPVLVGSVSTLLVFLHFRVFKYGRTEDRTVHYTLYAVDKDVVNWTPTDEEDPNA